MTTYNTHIDNLRAKEVGTAIDTVVKTIHSRVSSLSGLELKEYNDSLTVHASSDKVIILSFVDMSFLDMALNFYETSIVKFNIDNYLFLTNDATTCQMFRFKMINCYVYAQHKDTTNEATIYNSIEFNKKMAIRPYFILDALICGFTVLHCDVDVVFFRNPLTDLKSSVTSDVACLLDIEQCNAGFVYIKPTIFALDLYTTIIKTIHVFQLDDQTALKRALDSLTKIYQSHVHHNQTLDDNKYQCGVKYFQIGERYFIESSPCSRCIVVHNNWIVTKEAKRYRFRELLLWSYDNNGYYSNTSTKYIIYSNPPISSSLQKDSISLELNTLKTVLYIGHVLKRVVILPRFHLAKSSNSKRQSAERLLNNWLKMADFDGQFFDKYRENCFLRHPKVPEMIKNDITSPFWIKTEQSMAILGYHPPGVSVITPHDKKMISTRELEELFGSQRSSVLNFHSLYGLFGTDVIPKSAEMLPFNRKLKLAFKYTYYNQL